MIVAMTYAVASKLPTVILDFLLLLPHRLADLRESLQATADIPPPIPATTASAAPLGSRQSSDIPQAPLSESQHTDTTAPTSSESGSSAYASEADGEASTNASQIPTRAGSTIAESWVSVHDEE